MELKSDHEDVGELCAKRVDVMLREYDSMTKAIKLLANAIIRDFQIFLAFVAALAAFGRETNQIASSIIDMKIVICLTPFLIFAFGLFFLAKFSQMLADSAYTSYIERKVNESLKAPLLNWESTMSKNLLFRWRSSFLWCSLIFSFTVFAAYVLTAQTGYQYTLHQTGPFHDYSYWVRVLYWTCPCVFVLLLLLLRYERKSAEKKINELVQANQPLLDYECDREGKKVISGD